MPKKKTRPKAQPNAKRGQAPAPALKNPGRNASSAALRPETLAGAAKSGAKHGGVKAAKAGPKQGAKRAAKSRPQNTRSRKTQDRVRAVARTADREARAPVSSAYVVPHSLPLLPVRDLVIFPGMNVPLLVGRSISVEAVRIALSPKGGRLVFLVAQRDGNEEEPAPDTLYSIGTIGMIVRMRRLGDGRMKILVQGLERARVAGFEKRSPYMSAHVERLVDAAPGAASAGAQSKEAEAVEPIEVEALLRATYEQLGKLAGHGKVVTPEIANMLGQERDAGRLADAIAPYLGLTVAEGQEVLELGGPFARLRRISELVARELDLLEVQARIRTRTQQEMSKTQREYYLREQMRAIRNELGDADHREDEIAELQAKIARAGLPEEARTEAEKQIRRMEHLHPDAAELPVLRGYLEWIVDLPWSVRTPELLDLAAARAILDEDHYDLENIKDRILEYLAVRKLRGGHQGPILCFLGPPGVGKTSLGRSIARALGRKFVRISLGGVRDEAEIRGHRRTYVGAMPGRILQGMKQAGAINPVFMLDEIDKLGNDQLRGNPSAALLEVLDPEQNRRFRDHYLNLDFDLSQVLFVATANSIDPIVMPLRDRMEVISLSGYAEAEKVAIARRHLVPRQLEENGLKPEWVTLSNDALRKMILEYTREAGLRELERVVAQVFRKIARKFAESGTEKRVRVGQNNLDRFLGAPRYPREVTLQESDEVGVAKGLAWTPYGGEVLAIEAQKMPSGGKGSLILTGQLGDVMKESAQTALSYARAFAANGAEGPEAAVDEQIHLHVPAGAVPKDGPSAGVSMACVLVSLLTGIPVKSEVAMTGEVTLRGHVLGVGGLKEKLLAAVREGITKVVVPHSNMRDIEEIPRGSLGKLEVVPAKTMEDVFGVAFASAVPGRKAKAGSQESRPTPSKSRPAHV